MKEHDNYLHSQSAFVIDRPEYTQPIDEDCSNGVIPQEASVIGSLSEDGKRRILISEVSAVNKPFFDRNRAIMTRHINDLIRRGILAGIVPFSFTTRRITYKQRDYKHVNFWKMDRTNFIADVEVRLQLDISK